MAKIVCFFLCFWAAISYKYHGYTHHCNVFFLLTSMNLSFTQLLTLKLRQELRSLKAQQTSIYISCLSFKSVYLRFVCFLICYSLRSYGQFVLQLGKNFLWADKLYCVLFRHSGAAGYSTVLHRGQAQGWCSLLHSITSLLCTVWPCLSCKIY